MAETQYTKIILCKHEGEPEYSKTARSIYQKKIGHEYKDFDDNYKYDVNCRLDKDMIKIITNYHKDFKSLYYNEIADKNAYHSHIKASFESRCDYYEDSNNMSGIFISKFPSEFKNYWSILRDEDSEYEEYVSIDYYKYLTDKMNEILQDNAIDSNEKNIQIANLIEHTNKLKFEEEEKKKYGKIYGNMIDDIIEEN